MSYWPAPAGGHWRLHGVVEAPQDVEWRPCSFGAEGEQQVYIDFDYVGDADRSFPSPVLRRTCQAGRPVPLA